MKFAAYLETFNQVAATLKAKRYEVAFTQQGIEDWEQWWAAAQAEPAFAELLAERERRFAQRAHDWVRAGYDFHKSALYEAGFSRSRYHLAVPRQSCAHGRAIKAKTVMLRSA